MNADSSEKRVWGSRNPAGGDVGNLIVNDVFVKRSAVLLARICVYLRLSAAQFLSHQDCRLTSSCLNHLQKRDLFPGLYSLQRESWCRRFAMPHRQRCQDSQILNASRAVPMKQLYYLGTIDSLARLLL